MSKLICHSLYAVFIAVVLGVLAAPGTVGLSQPAQDPKKQSKQEREYQKIKQFSEKLYAEDAVFREEIENLYYRKQVAAAIKDKLEAGELIGSSAEFARVMAELKRDNGVRALYYDMFQGYSDLGSASTHEVT
jgi:hypothetical protein